jgi:hypothetical protein
MADGFTHAPHDAVSTLVEDDLERGVVALILHQANARRRRRSVVEGDALA